MKNKIRLIIILGFVNFALFFFVAVPFILAYPVLPITLLFPDWNVWSLFPIILFITSLVISYYIIFRSNFGIGYKEGASLIISIVSYLLYSALGLGLGFGILLLNDSIPKYFSRRERKIEETLVEEARETALYQAEVGEPVFLASRDLENKVHEQFHFIVQIPINVKQNFALIQILNTFSLKFESQDGKISLPAVYNCTMADSWYRLSVYDPSGKLLVSKVRRDNKKKYPPGKYLLEFTYDYSGSSTDGITRNCKLKNINSLLGEKVNLMTKVNSDLVKSFVIDRIR